MLAAIVVAVVLGGGPEPGSASANDRPATDASPTPSATAFPSVAGRSTRWAETSASYYEPTGNRTSCGAAMTWTSWHVASLKPSTYRCGLRVVICNRAARSCATVRVKDRGAWRSDNRRWDLTPAVRRALRCSDLCRVHWRVAS